MRSGTDLSSRLDGATLAMVSGKLTEAEAICEQILATDPNFARAHLLRGIIAQRLRRPADAMASLLRAHELNPQSYDAAACLAAGYRIGGDLPQALPFAELAVQLRPQEAMARTELGSIYVELLRFHDAEEHLRKAVKLSGGDLQAQLALNQCLNREGKEAEALQVLRQALRAFAMTTEDLLEYGANMLGQSNPGAAAEACLEASRLAPKMLRVRAQLARALVEAGRTAEAASVLDDPTLLDCLRNDPADSESLTVLGMAYQSLGRVKEAREWLRRAIDAPNPIGLAFYAYVYSGRVTDSDIVRAIEARISLGSNPVDSPPLHFALGKALEDLGDYEQAMKEYEAANSQTSEAAPFDRMKAGSTADQTLSTFTKEFLLANGGNGPAAELLIFVVGMIRSGTTLAEQVLSSHPDVGGAGEVPFWVYNTLDVMDAATGVVFPDRLRDAADRYLALLAAGHPGKSRVVDKMPVNFKNLGVLHLAFPNARFIHMRRHPVDTCLSIYSTHSRALAEFGNKKANLVSDYRQYQRVMEWWRSVLPEDRLLDVDYEDLVTQSEPTIRRMVSFCGLEWNDACLHPEANERAVATPSLWQVRRPINPNSVGRWQRFLPWLGEFRELLSE